MGGQYDVLIVGGGAAGLMCALTAGKRGKRVLVVEHANRVGKKILMSGGGRCFVFPGRMARRSSTPCPSRSEPGARAWSRPMARARARCCAWSRAS